MKGLITWPTQVRRSPQPQAVSSSYDLMRLLLAQTTESESGERITTDSALRAAAVFACVRVLSEDVGKLPCILYRRTKDGGKERATSDPRYRLVRAKPNGWQTAIAFFGMGQSHIELSGAAAAFVTRDLSGRPLELLPLVPERVRVEQDTSWNVRYYIANRNGGEQEVPAKNMLYVPGLSIDGVTGLSTIGYARETIGTALATERHGARFFRNSARPSLIIQRPKDAPVWSHEAAQAFVDSIKAAWGGANTSTVGMLEDGMTANALTINAKDAQFLETRDYTRSQIAGVFRVPPHKIGDLSRATFSNIEHQSLEYLSDSLLPRLVRWEQALTRALLTEAEQEEFFFEFLVDALLRADFKTRMDGYAVAIQNGIMNPNEARSKENMNPRDGGDEFLRPANMVPSNAPANPANPDPSSAK
jgi:HK97 family phage portal protein